LIERPPAFRVHVASVADVCAFVDRLDGGAAGELIFTSESAVGAVFIERSRICWAAANGLARRLTELLVESAGVGADTIESFYRRCKSERRPLGETLVSEGLVSANDLRAALAQHTVESLVALVDSGQTASWYPRPAGGYSARYTFGTAEMLSRACASSASEAARIAEHEMRACFFGSDWAAAFVRSASRALPEPIAIHGNAPSAAAELGRAAKWAVSALDVVSAFGPDDAVVAVRAPVAAREDGREMRIAFKHHGVLITGEASAHSPGRILNRRASARRAKG
jgi:hypothetical protein